MGRDPKKPVGPANPLDHREPTGTTFPAMELERISRERKLANVRVVQETSKVSHNEAPRARLAELLKAASFLENR